MNGPFSDDQLMQLQRVLHAALKPMEDRIVETRGELTDIQCQLSDGGERMNRIEGELKKNSVETSATRDASAEMLEAFNFAKRGLAFIGAFAAFIGRVVTWAVKVGVPVGAAYAAVRGWKWPWTR